MTYKELAERCKVWRESEGITQEQIAKTARVTRQAVSAFESGAASSLTIYCAYLSNGFSGGIEKAEPFFRSIYGGGNNGT